jgi:4-carboxymuconolactone decarboxylase
VRAVSTLPSDADRYTRGLERYADQFGVEPAEAEARLRSQLGERMATEAILGTGGSAWDEDELSLRDRSMIVLAALITQGGVESRLRGHLRWAIAHDVTPAQVDALVTLLANYVGFPKASVAMEVVRAELAEMGLPLE